MSGWFPLSERSVRSHTWRGWPGVYRLAHSPYGSPVRYIGRSDTSVRRRLLRHVREGVYDYFYVEHKETPPDAFERECNLFHYYRDELHNETHPGRPRGYRGQCPRCSEFR
ncbi:MAG: hypothetical protein ACE5KH_05145 [Candidatus Geothermarchaeales archaeon]